MNLSKKPPFCSSNSLPLMCCCFRQPWECFSIQKPSIKGHSCGVPFCSVSEILYDFTLSPPCCLSSPHVPGQRHHTLFQRYPAVPITPRTQTAVSPLSGVCSRAVWQIEAAFALHPRYLMSSCGLLSLLACHLYSHYSQANHQAIIPSLSFQPPQIFLFYFHCPNRPL